MRLGGSEEWGVEGGREGEDEGRREIHTVPRWPLCSCAGHRQVLTPLLSPVWRRSPRSNCLDSD